VLLGGEDFHVKSTFVTGWEPLGQPLDVTAAEGANLLELNGLPAYETYNRYLNIPNDKNFFFNTLEFPFLYRLNGIDIMRAPLTSNPDGSLTMTADIDQGVSARIAYGDPWTILNTVWQQGNELLAYAPECIVVFSCAGRRTFWGNADIGKETEAYQIVAPTSGFYTAGEFLRTKGFVNLHNVTQVIAAMREGEAQPRPEQELRMAEHSFEGKVSMINRMATFIKVTTAELAEANRKLREANHLLSEMSVTDALTGIGNRTAYLDRTRHLDVLIQEGRAVFCVAAFDLNGLKTINDNYGHECGDMALIDAAEQLIEVFGRGDLYRVGGDEFLAVLERCSGEEMARLFTRLEESLRKANQTEKPYKLPLAISKGYAVFLPGEDSEYSTVARRADGAMYRDKAEYYRTHDRRRR